MNSKRLKKLITGLTRPKLQRGIVHAIDLHTIDVRMAQSGLVRNVSVVGDIGQLKRGDEVELSWDEVERRPVAVTATIIGDAEVDDGDGEVATGSRNAILLIGPDIERTYAIDPKGLSAAVENSFEGCVIYVPRGIIPHTFRIPVGVHLVGGGMGATKIVGTVQGGAGIHNLSILHAASPAVAYHYLGGETLLDNVSLEAYGDRAECVSICGSGVLTIWNCDLKSEGEVGLGISYRYGTASVEVLGGRIEADRIYVES